MEKYQTENFFNNPAKIQLDNLSLIAPSHCRTYKSKSFIAHLWLKAKDLINPKQKVVVSCQIWLKVDVIELQTYFNSLNTFLFIPTFDLN